MQSKTLYRAIVSNPHIRHSKHTSLFTQLSNDPSATNQLTRPIGQPHPLLTSSSAVAERPRDALVSRNSATTKYRYRVALFA